MTWWKARDPGLFPPAWHAAIRAGAGDHLIQIFYTDGALKGARRRWRVFMLSLRAFPQHPTAQFAEGLMQRTRVQWNAKDKVYEFRLTSRRTVLEDLKKPLQLLGPED
jgi:hypothetical protein